jgi:O-antigen/teichoic acid export membrane protein
MIGYAVAHVLVALACGLWAYGDAKRRQHPGILWLLVVFCAFPFGLVLWLFSRPKIEKIPLSDDPDAVLKKMANRGAL